MIGKDGNVVLKMKHISCLLVLKIINIQKMYLIGWISK